jgi:hypothetical protein
MSYTKSSSSVCGGSDLDLSDGDASAVSGDSALIPVAATTIPIVESDVAERNSRLVVVPIMSFCNYYGDKIIVDKNNRFVYLKPLL